MRRDSVLIMKEKMSPGGGLNVRGTICFVSSVYRCLLWHFSIKGIRLSGAQLTMKGIPQMDGRLLIKCFQWLGENNHTPAWMRSAQKAGAATLSAEKAQCNNLLSALGHGQTMGCHYYFYKLCIYWFRLFVLHFKFVKMYYLGCTKAIIYEYMSYGISRISGDILCLLLSTNPEWSDPTKKWCNSVLCAIELRCCLINT